MPPSYAVYEKIRITIVMSARQTGHPAGMLDTRVIKTRRTVHVRTAPVWRQHVAPWGTLGSSRQRLMLLPLLVTPTPLTLSLLALAPNWPHPHPRCCFCCRHAAARTPYERRQNGWQQAETAGDSKPRWQICLSSCLAFFGRRMFNPLRRRATYYKTY